jgi:hypothetical protein
MVFSNRMAPMIRSPREDGAGHDARPHLMHDRKHLLLVGPCIVPDSVRTQRVRRAPAALIQRRDETGMCPHLLQSFFEIVHLAPHRPTLPIR